MFILKAFGHAKSEHEGKGLKMRDVIYGQPLMIESIKIGHFVIKKRLKLYITTFFIKF